MRLFHSILAQRLDKVCEFHHFQRAFRPIDGITTSMFDFLSLLKLFHAKGWSLYVVSIDLAKAFDSISHCSIFCRLHAMKVHPLLSKYVMSMYNSNLTYICWGNQCIVNVNM